ncbi:sensor histidine kinase [Sphingomonas parva]|nr:histidine kinase [Sphingomonas parva]
MTFSLWLLVLFAYGVGELIAGRYGFLADFPIDFVAVLIVASLVLPAYPLVLALGRRTSVERWAVLGVACLLISFAQSVVNMFENRILGVIPALSADHFDLIRQRFSRNFQGHLYITFANVALIAFIVQVRRSADGAVALAEARAAADRERLGALRLQLNPHFLFNALNSISSLITVGRHREADEMIDLLSDFLRGSLETSDDTLVTLDDELATIETYLGMQMVRFGERLNVGYEIDPSLADQLRLPNFVLQPLVENAIKYAVAPTPGPVSLTISARVAGQNAVLEISDDGRARAEDRPSNVTGMGIGLTNTRERLAMQYGEAARLETEQRPEGGWTSRIVIPFPTPE